MQSGFAQELRPHGSAGALPRFNFLCKRSVWLCLLIVLNVELSGCTPRSSCRFGDADCNLTTLFLYLRHKVGRFLYFTDQGGGVIYVSRIQASGALSAPQAAASLTGANSIDVDATGTMLAAAGNGLLNVYRIHPETGSLTFLNSDGIIGAPSSIVFDPQSRFVAATQQASGHVLCPVNGFTGLGTCVKHTTNFLLSDIAPGPDGSVLYGADTDTPASVYAFSINSTTLQTTMLGSAMGSGGNTLAGMLTDASGRHVYIAFVAGSPNGPYSTVNLNADGSIASIANSTIVNGFVGGALDPTESMIYLNQSSNSLIMGIKRNPDGSLANTPSTLLNVSGGPGKLRMEPQGRFLYVLNSPAINVLSVEGALASAQNLTATATGFGIGMASYYEYP